MRVSAPEKGARTFSYMTEKMETTEEAACARKKL
jgi:hypothetical protein